jgi:hypothetical protein
MKGRLQTSNLITSDREVHYIYILLYIIATNLYTT